MKSASDESADASTGLPWPKSWRGVYLLVLGTFAVVVALLARLTGMNS